jgi:hypothetical protein
VPVFNARNIASQQPGSLLDVPWDSFLASRNSRKRSPIIITLQGN